MSCGGDGVDERDPAPVPLTVSPSTINLASNAGAQGSFTINCKGSWVATCTETWISLSATSGTDLGAIIVTASLLFRYEYNNTL